MSRVMTWSSSIPRTSARIAIACHHSAVPLRFMGLVRVSVMEIQSIVRRRGKGGALQYPKVLPSQIRRRIRAGGEHASSIPAWAGGSHPYRPLTPSPRHDMIALSNVEQCPIKTDRSVVLTCREIELHTASPDDIIGVMRCCSFCVRVKAPPSASPHTL